LGIYAEAGSLDLREISWAVWKNMIGVRVEPTEDVPELFPDRGNLFQTRHGTINRMSGNRDIVFNLTR